MEGGMVSKVWGREAKMPSSCWRVETDLGICAGHCRGLLPWVGRRGCLRRDRSAKKVRRLGHYG